MSVQDSYTCGCQRALLAMIARLRTTPRPQAEGPMRVIPTPIFCGKEPLAARVAFSTFVCNTTTHERS